MVVSLNSRLESNKEEEEEEPAALACGHKPSGQTVREFFIDNLLVRIHIIIEMILVDRPRAMGV